MSEISTARFLPWAPEEAPTSAASLTIVLMPVSCLAALAKSSDAVDRFEGLAAVVQTWTSSGEGARPDGAGAIADADGHVDLLSI